MKNIFNYNIKGSLFLIVSILFLIIGINDNYFFESSNNNILSVQEKIQKRSIEREKHLEKSINQIVEKVNQNVDFKTLNNLCRENHYSKDRTVFLFYKNNTLHYWSSNRVPVSNIFDSVFLSKNFALLKNGWYQIYCVSKLDYKIVGLSLVKNNYPYENQYLDNSYESSYNLSENVKISFEKGKYNIYNSSNKFLYSINIDEVEQKSDFATIRILFFYLLHFVFLILSFQLLVLKRISSLKIRNICSSFVVISIIAFRLFSFIYKFPANIYQTKLFSPIYYASSFWLPSLGDLLINSLFLLLIIFFIKKNIKKGSIINIKNINNKLIKILLTIVLIGFQVIIFNYLIVLIEGLIIDSTILLSLENIFDYSILSYLCFLIIGIMILIFILISFSINSFINKLFNKKWILLTIYTVLGFICGYIIYRYSSNNDLYLFLVLYLLLILYFTIKKINIISIKVIFSLLVLSSLFATTIINKFYDFKEKESRKLLASKVSLQHDPITEFQLNEICDKISKDEKVKLFCKKLSKNETKLIEYINKVYFNDLTQQYKLNITCCLLNQMLIIQPQNYNINCSDYFNNKIQTVGQLTQYDNVWFMNYNNGMLSYLTKVEVQIAEKLKNVFIFIELDSKSYINDNGYPELLIDKNIKTQNIDFANYSYARYINDELVNQYGKFYYSSKFSNYKIVNKEQIFVNIDGYNHLFYFINNNETIILSKRNQSFFEKIAPVSFFFVFYGLLIILILLFTINILKIRDKKLTFQSQLQLVMTIIIVVSFASICYVTITYFVKFNINKNSDFVTEKAHSVMIQLEEKLYNEEIFKVETNSILNTTVNQLSGIFFTDINVYNPEGFLLATSRPQIYQQGLISDKMNIKALDDFRFNKKTIYFHDERIGRQKYWSVYMPFRNKNGQIIAYINLPYFAKQNEQNREISSFLIAFLSVYVLIIFLAIFVGLFLANVITKPLKLMREKIGKIKLMGKNEKIDWTSKDEIGNLVEEYNRMVDELNNSAELLATSQRELAWREMARQVAHEIKNPLTPMKLSVQLLQRSWNDKAPDYNERMKRFTKTIVEQIDTLSDIASSFSDFAKMPQGNYSVEDLGLITSSVIELFKDQNANIYIHKSDIEYPVYVDKNQLIRVLNNLIRNSVQSFKNIKKGNINIYIENRDEDYWLLKVEDNGDGIAEDLKHKIFAPNFTTKSGGMGLGLAMVHNIIIGFGGDIWFESEEGKGTTFYITIKKYKE